jgi:hypothetical protein
LHVVVVVALVPSPTTVPRRNAEIRIAVVRYFAVVLRVATVLRAGVCIARVVLAAKVGVTAIPSTPAVVMRICRRTTVHPRAVIWGVACVGTVANIVLRTRIRIADVSSVACVKLLGAIDWPVRVCSGLAGCSQERRARRHYGLEKAPAREMLSVAAQGQADRSKSRSLS